MVQKSFLRTNYIESNIEENIVKKNQFKIENIPGPIENSDAVCDSYEDVGLNDLSIRGNNAHVAFNDKNLRSVNDNVRFVEVIRLPAVENTLHQNFTLMKLFFIV